MRVRAGFIPLVDSAVLVAAARRGFAARAGIQLELSAEPSWATLRDKLTVGAIDAAHMLGPIPVASQLGLGNPEAPMVAPFALSAHGNALSVSNALWEAMVATGRLAGPRDVVATAAALGAAIRARGRAKPVFAIVHPFSAHNFSLRYVLAAAGIHPDRDVTLTVVPPPRVVAALAAGEIDAFCVGAPWSDVGLAAGVSRPVLVERDVWRMAPEKVLAMREDRAEADGPLTDALLHALKAAAAWVADSGNRDELVRLLAAPHALGVAAEAIAASLSGSVALSGGAPVTVDDAIVFDASPLLVPRESHALWFYAQMVRWGMITPSPAAEAAARRSYRPDIFARAFGGEVPPPAPGETFDSVGFDPAAVADYVDGFALHARRTAAA